MTLTTFLAKHRPNLTSRDGGTYPFECGCGTEFVDGNNDRHWREYERHVVEELAAANIVAIELPEGRISNGWWESKGKAINVAAFGPGELLSDGLAYLAAAAAVRPTPTPGETP